jgi:hypothetical protein
VSNLGVIERKVLGALIMSPRDVHGITQVTLRQIAQKMGYKASGGALTFALKTLEMNNYIEKVETNKYKVFI